jgi:hypothetical protein
MTYALGSRSLSFCAHVDPKLMAVVKRAISICPVDFGMTEDQSRTVAQQAAKVAAGVSHVRPGPAARHMIQPDGYSKAVDLVPWVDGRFQWGDKNWKVHTADGRTLDPFFDIAAAMVASCNAAGAGRQRPRYRPLRRGYAPPSWRITGVMPVPTSTILATGRLPYD